MEQNIHSSTLGQFMPTDENQWRDKARGFKVKR